MKIHAVAFVLFVVLGCAGFAAENNFALKTVPAACEAFPGTRMRVDWQRLISRYNIELPVLPDNHTESLRLGNGDIGAAVYSVPECLVLSWAGTTCWTIAQSPWHILPKRPL